jgi:hypothetical protein
MTIGSAYGEYLTDPEPRRWAPRGLAILLVLAIVDALVDGDAAGATLAGNGLLRLALKSSADPTEAKAESINRHDWHDPQSHHEQDHMGARDGVIAVGLKNSCKCQNYNRPKNRS